MQSNLGKFGDLGDNMAVSSCTISEAMEQVLLEPDGFSVRVKNGGNISMKIEGKHNLYGEREPKITAIGDGSIIKMFDKTPPPKDKTDVVCPHFMELKWANGCNFDCSWCYLNGTMRFRPMGKLPYLKNEKKIIEHLKIFLDEKDIPPTILNSGELSDSLVYEGNGFSLTNDIIPLFKEQSRHKLLILSKSTNIKKLLKSESQNNVIVSFSVNALPVAKRWEKKAPSPDLRIEAAKQLSDAGYEVRLRIDPMVPIRYWRKNYGDLIDLVYQNFRPKRITLGSLRGLQSTINFCPDKSWTSYLSDRSNWGLKAPDEDRLKMYSFIMDKINQYDQKINVGLCKETVGMWEEIGDWKGIKCNCML